jgi:glycosyltransferase involved in cell wall biosynthesis
VHSDECVKPLDSPEIWEETGIMESLEMSSAPLPIPLVSVAITTFNSANWLPRALDSVLKQQTDFPIEIVIGDDCSQDTTVAIAYSYQERHPDVIRILERSKNGGIQRNYYETFEQCRGKFIAWLDADDYWTDPEKLAIQVEAMESDPSISLCGHFVRHVTNDGKVERDRFPCFPFRPAGRYGFEKIIRSCFIPTPSVLFRNGIQRDLPLWYFDLAPATDWPIYVFAALTGDIVLLDRVMADYVLTPDSAGSSKGDMFWLKMHVRFYDYVESNLPSKWHRVVRAEKGRRYESIAYLLRKQGDFAASREAAFKAFLSPSLMDNLGSKTKALLAQLVREAEWRLSGGRAASDKPKAELK